MTLKKAEMENEAGHPQNSLYLLRMMFSKYPHQASVRRGLVVYFLKFLSKFGIGKNRDLTFSTLTYLKDTEGFNLNRKLDGDLYQALSDYAEQSYQKEDYELAVLFIETALVFFPDDNEVKDRKRYYLWIHLIANSAQLDSAEKEQRRKELLRLVEVVPTIEGQDKKRYGSNFPENVIRLESAQKDIQFSGPMTNLITPFKGGEIDEGSFKRLVELQVEAGISGIVTAGIAGEGSTLSQAEHLNLIDIARQFVGRNFPVIANTGLPSTEKTIEFGLMAKDHGASAVLVSVPYYNKPTQNGLYQHFSAIDEAINLPIFIGNTPGRTVIDMGMETTSLLSMSPNIVGIVDSSSDTSRISLLRLYTDPQFSHFCGDDGVLLSSLASGSHGFVSTAANVSPILCIELYQAVQNGNLKEAQKLEEQISTLTVNLYCETSPGPTKFALSTLGICSDETRLPLTELAESNKKKVQTVLTSMSDLMLVSRRGKPGRSRNSAI